MFRPAYFPVYISGKDIEETGLENIEETGLENKFGGSVPFFVKGETWPLDLNSNPMIFICQFRLNIYEDNCQTLYRVFLSKNINIVTESNSIQTIKLNEENLKNQIRLDANLISNSIQLEANPLYIITNWKKKQELVSWSELQKIIKTDEQYDSFTTREEYNNHSLYPSEMVKFGGTPIYCQYNEQIQKNFLQLTQCEICPYKWGDSGIAHISEDGYLSWDCC